MRKRLADDGVALTERLCVYPQYIDPEWMAQGVLDVVKAKYWIVHPAPRLRAPRGAPRDPPRTSSAGAIARGRDGASR